MAHPGFGAPILPAHVERWKAEGPGHRPVTVLRLNWDKGPMDGWFLMYIQRARDGTTRAVASAGLAHGRPLYLPSAVQEPITCRLEAGLWDIATPLP